MRVTVIGTIHMKRDYFALNNEEIKEREAERVRKRERERERERETWSKY